VGSFLLYRLNIIVNQHLIREIQLLKQEVALLKEQPLTLKPAPLPSHINKMNQHIGYIFSRLKTIEEKLGIKQEEIPKSAQWSMAGNTDETTLEVPGSDAETKLETP
tara:strand:- start:132 stop:452 length:321 start_codon:yes stop_codon:yes gene_type:complete